MSTPIPPSNGRNRNALLLGLAAVLAVQIPMTVQAIPDAIIRAVFQVVILIVVIGLAWKAR